MTNKIFSPNLTFIPKKNNKMFNLKEQVDFSTYRLIFPSLGVGNIGQLVVDLLIENLHMKKVATGWHKAVVPIIGPKPFRRDTDPTSTSFEIYIDESSKLAVIQLRTPITAKFLPEFLEDLSLFVLDKKFQEILILTSAHDYEKKWEFNQKTIETISNKSNIEIGADFQIPGGGFALKFFKVLSGKEVPSEIMYISTSEGDNSGDALLLLSNVNSKLKLFQHDVKFRYPISWKLLFGNAAPQHIY